MDIRELKADGANALVSVDFCPGVMGARVTVYSFRPWRGHEERSLNVLRKLQRMLVGRKTEILAKDHEWSLHIRDGEPLSLVSELKELAQGL